MPVLHPLGFSRMRAVWLLPLLLAGCAEGPFVDLPVAQSVEKPEDPVKKSGQIGICYNASTPWGEIEVLAAETCGKHGYQAKLLRSERWQCRATAPHRAVFNCFLPTMTDERGRLISPSDTNAIEAWRKRTGNPLPRPGVVQPGTTPPASAAAPYSAPPPAPVTAPAPAILTPADIAGKPAFPSAPPPAAGPVAPVPAVQAVPGFTLEPGSWGQYFEE